MICRRFTIILLCSTLFCGIFAHFSSAEVVQAYRIPSEADLQWLLGHSTTDIPSVVELSPVVQISGERLAPPDKVPKEPDFAILISDSTVERLPVPENRKQTWDIPGLSIADARSKITSGHKPLEELSCENFQNDNSLCGCFTCTVCGDHHKRMKTVFCVPDMIGGSAWLKEYQVGTRRAAFTSPTMLLSRPNVAEHFNADVQNRIWADYRHWSNAVSFNQESRAVDQYSFGLETQILKGSSIEVRLPLFYQYGSKQDGGAASLELGNMSVFAKQILRQGSRWTFVGGIGASLPTAENWRPGVGILKNNAYYLVPFLGAQWHPNNITFGHIVVQADVPIEKNELILGSERVKVDGQQVMRTGVQFGRWIYRADHGKRACRFGVFAEIDYAAVTDRSAYWADARDTIYVSTAARKSTLSATVGMPMVFGKVTCTNALILPVSGNNRAFSAAYNFSLSRQF